MDIIEAIKNRNSVRNYWEKDIENEKVKKIHTEIQKINAANNLNFKLFVNEPNAFNSFLAYYGKFKNAKNYIALVGKDCENLEERIGYFGQHIVLFAQQLGLNTCWVALTYKKRMVKKLLEKNERLVCVLTLGYGIDQGTPHVSKNIEAVCKYSGKIPVWFKNGIEMALLAPTAVNQQKFLFTLLDNKRVKAEATGGIVSKVDLGIAKYHFEIGAGKEEFTWTE